MSLCHAKAKSWQHCVINFRIFSEVTSVCLAFLEAQIDESLARMQFYEIQIVQQCCVQVIMIIAFIATMPGFRAVCLADLPGRIAR